MVKFSAVIFGKCAIAAKIASIGSWLADTSMMLSKTTNSGKHILEHSVYKL